MAITNITLFFPSSGFFSNIPSEAIKTPKKYFIIKRFVNVAEIVVEINALLRIDDIISFLTKNENLNIKKNEEHWIIIKFNHVYYQKIKKIEQETKNGNPIAIKKYKKIKSKFSSSKRRVLFAKSYNNKEQYSLYLDLDTCEVYAFINNVMVRYKNIQDALTFRNFEFVNDYAENNFEEFESTNNLRFGNLCFNDPFFKTFDINDIIFDDPVLEPSHFNDTEFDTSLLLLNYK